MDTHGTRETIETAETENALEAALAAARAERRAVAGLPWVGLVLREIEHRGSRAEAVWDLFWLVFAKLSERDVQRVVFAAGERGRALRPVIRAEQRLRRHLAAARSWR